MIEFALLDNFVSNFSSVNQEGKNLFFNAYHVIGV